jgi:ankyrin repeat protein
VRALLAAGANVESALFMGCRPLHAASRNGRVVVATLLLDAGADINALTNGHTPLFYAKTPEMRALLVARGGV